MAYQPGIFQYGTIGADGGGYDDYGFGTDQIYTLPPFKVNENTGNTGTDLNNTFVDPTLGSLYGAGLTGGNIFTGGGGGAGGGSAAVAGAGGYIDPVNQDLFNKGLIGPAGDAANLAANPNYKSPAPGAMGIPPIGPNDTIKYINPSSGLTNISSDGGYIDPANQDLFNKGLIGPASNPNNLAANPNANPDLINYIKPSSGPTILPKVEVPIGPGAGGYPLFDDVNINLYNRGLVGPYSNPLLIGLNPNATNPTSDDDTIVQVPKVVVPGTKINDELDSAAALRLLNSIRSGVNTDSVPLSTASVFTGPTPSSGTVVLPPFEVPGTKINNELDPGAALRLLNSIGSGVYTNYVPLSTASVFTGPTPSSTLLQLPKVEVPIGPNSQQHLDFMNRWLGQVGNLGNPIILPAVSNFPVVTISITPIKVIIPTPIITPYVSITPFTVFTPGPTATAPSTVPNSVTPSVPFDPNTINTGVGTYGTNAQTLTTKRDFGKELEESLAALQKNQSGIMGMYGDLYKQFMPKGITDTESSVIDQYKTDLARLQQRQAGVLAPEDIRQSQQAAREAYGARGQVMGRGAVGAEIMGRENIRQQREDQARAGMQASYGNIMNMANLQTGNIFSPIGNLMSNTFNPLSPYAADVYGTNVNAQLAKEIAQKNYDAAVRSAELSGAAQKSAATTSAIGGIFGPAVGGLVGKGLGTLFGLPLPSCMPGNQCIDTPTGPKAIKDLKGGDSVIGYDGEVAFIAQACSWNQNPLRTFLTITRDDGSSFTVCDDHKIMGIPAMEWVEGAELAGSIIKSIEESTGLLTSYDIFTNQGGYRINGIPVNSMIPDIVMQVVEFHRQVDRNLQAIST